MIKSFFLRLYKIIKSLLLVFLIYNALVIFVILFFRFIDPSSTAFIYSKIEEPFISLFDTEDIKYKPVSLNNISYTAPLAVIASEDQTFFEHFGFDFEQIEKAMKENSRRKRQRGASTITMQVSKNLFLWSGKNIVRKGLEAYYTLLLEVFWSKKRIIEVYLNVAEMGKGIYGVNEAARIYYRKSSSKLNMSEAATLAAILPNPVKRNPVRPSGYVIGRRSRIITQMNLIGGKTFIKENLY